MRRNSKANLDIYAKMPLRITSENTLEEHTIVVADCNNFNMPLEKRKEEAGKPLYLSRV